MALIYSFPLTPPFIIATRKNLDLGRLGVRSFFLETSEQHNQPTLSDIVHYAFIDMSTEW